MGLLGKILGPQSKYDSSLPYAYEARIPSFEDGSEHKAFLSDTICGLIEHLQRSGIAPDGTQILEIYRERETPIEARMLTGADGQWLSKPDLCRAFAQHYPGHIREAACSFEDRGRDCLGP